MVEYLQGIVNIANLVLALIAGFFAVSLFRVSHKTKHLKPWKILILVLLLFVIQEIVGAGYAFGIVKPSFITHLIPTIMLVLLIWTVDTQVKEFTKPRRK